MATPCWRELSTALQDALDDAAAFPLSCLSGDEAVACLRDLHSMRAMLDSVICRAFTETTAAAATAAETGHRSVAALVAAETKSNPRTTRADQNLGSWLADYPIIARSFADGLLSKAHADAIRARENARTRPHLCDAQAYLVEAATTCQWNEFLATLRYWELAADPDGLEPEEQVQRRQLRYSKRPDGTVTGRFTFDPLSGQAFFTAVEKEVERLFREDSETGSLRTVPQRRADALIGLLTTSGKGGPRPALVHVVMSEQVAAAHFDALANDCVPQRLSLEHGDDDKRCELIDGTPLHPNYALATLAKATFRRLVFSTDGEQVDLGRRVRGFPAHLKDALLVRARGRCQHAGCDAPLSWLQADHLIPWSRGGTTSIANGQILCDPHNKLKRDRPPPPRRSGVPPPEP